MLPIRNISYLLPMCCSLWEKCKNSPKTGLGCSTPLSSEFPFMKFILFCTLLYSFVSLIFYLKDKYSTVKGNCDAVRSYWLYWWIKVIGYMSLFTILWISTVLFEIFLCSLINLLFEFLVKSLYYSSKQTVNFKKWYVFVLIRTIVFYNFQRSAYSALWFCRKSVWCSSARSLFCQFPYFNIKDKQSFLYHNNPSILIPDELVIFYVT